MRYASLPVHARAVVVAAIALAVLLATGVAADAAAPTKAQLRAALLTKAEMPGWSRSKGVAPGHKTFCNKPRHVEWQTFAGAFFDRPGPSFNDDLVAYSNRTWASRALHEVRRAAHSCSSYPVGGGFTEYLHPVKAPAFGDGTFALREKDWNHVGSPLYCFVVVTRHRQVNLSAGICSFSRPSRSRTVRLVRKAYRREVSVLG